MNDASLLNPRIKLTLPKNNICGVAGVFIYWFIGDIKHDESKLWHAWGTLSWNDKRPLYYGTFNRKTSELIIITKFKLGLKRLTENMQWWEILEIQRQSSKDDVKRSFRKLSHLYHPDKGGTHDNFILLKKAYDTAMTIL